MNAITIILMSVLAPVGPLGSEGLRTAAAPAILMVNDSKQAAPKAETAKPSEKSTEGSKNDEKKDAGSSAAAESSKGSEASSNSNSSGSPTAPSAEEVLDRLRHQRPQNPVIPPAGRSGRSSSESAGRLLPEGAQIIRRPGRLIREGDWWTFSFESDRPESPEPPMKILPCGALEQLIRASAGQSPGIVFIVSGETTVFQGENYLLPRWVMLRVDSGNLRK